VVIAQAEHLEARAKAYRAEAALLLAGLRADDTPHGPLSVVDSERSKTEILPPGSLPERSPGHPLRGSAQALSSTQTAQRGYPG
jgi:hypothetical protein